MDHISREKAKSLGLKRFFTGLACANSHVSERFVGNGQCVACRSAKYDPAWQRQYNAAYRSKNLDELRAYDRARYAANPEPDRERERRRYWENREANLAASKARREANKERYAESKRAYSLKNKDRISAAGAIYRAKNSAKIVARVREWRDENPDMARANHALRRARRRNAVPPWFGELDALVWLEAADLAQRREAATGFPWHADHMIPLAARRASGLHCASNCQVIPAALNMAKKNKLVLTEPMEWILFF